MKRINFFITASILGTIAVSRHFLPKKIILKAIAILAYYKINRLHLHLTDGKGLRVEIAALPNKLKAFDLVGMESRMVRVPVN